MSYAQQRSQMRQTLGFAFVVLLHLVLGYALFTGLGKQIIAVVKQPIETKIIEEKKPPPPEVPPPPPPPPPPLAPPPPFIPPPEIIINAPPPPPVVQQVTIVAPPAPVAPVAVRPVAPAPPAPSVPDRDAGEKPIGGKPLNYPKRMIEAGREGSVELECDIEVDGSATNCKVTAGGGAFAEAALDYQAQAKYLPKIEHGVPVKAPHHKLVVNFKLK